MKRRLLLLLTTLLLLLPLPAFADMGPKPSVQITLPGLPEGTCYATLLSATSSTGPYSAWEEGDPPYYYHDLETAPEVWQAFQDYRDGEGYHFLQTGWRVDQTGSFAWTYYPPSDFKLLLYFPDTGEYAVSAATQTYAFSSDYTAACSGASLTLRESYDYTWELLSLAVRYLLTLAVELTVALLFRLQHRGQLICLLQVNLVTQLLLNLGLNLVYHYQGGLAYFLLLFPAELAVFVVEAAAYARLLPRRSPVPVSPRRAVGYAFAANLASAWVGYRLALVFPGIF